MTLIRGGPAGPDADQPDGAYRQEVAADRAALWDALGGKQGILRGLDYTLPSGSLAMQFGAGAALVERRDAAGNPGTGEGYHVWADEDDEPTVLFEAPDANARSDAVVVAFCDTEAGSLGTGVTAVGPQVVVVRGVSGLTTPRTDSQIQAAIGAGGWFRYADVRIDPSDTEVDPANVTAASAQVVTAPYGKVYLAADAVVPNSLTTSTIPFDAGEDNVDGFADPANDRLVIPEDGLYLLTAQFSLTQNATGTRRLVITVNGTNEFAQEGPGVASGSDGQQVSVAGIAKLVAGDLVTALWAQDSGANRTGFGVSSGFPYNRLTALRVGS